MGFDVQLKGCQPGPALFGLDQVEVPHGPHRPKGRRPLIGAGPDSTAQDQGDSDALALGRVEEGSQRFCPSRQQVRATQEQFPNPSTRREIEESGLFGDRAGEITVGPDCQGR